MAASEPTAAERLIKGILPENPVYRQLLGMCPTQAVTNGMKPPDDGWRHGVYPDLRNLMTACCARA
jgi:hypothetical protein